MTEDLFVIRDMKADDISYILDLNEKANMTEGWSYMSYLGELSSNNKHYFVAEADDEVVGYVGYAHIIDEAHIMNIVVNEAFRGKGIGTALLKKVFDDAERRAIVAVTLEVRDSNAAAISVYEKLGFINVGLRKNYYNGREHARIYWKYF